MCGIAGIVSFGSGPEAVRPIAAMTAALRHRGPDDEGYLLADTRSGTHAAYRGADTIAALAGLPRLPDAPPPSDLAFGHRRLSIIDLSPGGHGPMASADGTAWVTYNGEVYNYRELRDELAAGGRRFRTASDTEVLLASWDRWGPECLHRLNGMWAFGLWDAQRRVLFCARDRFGVKPLYYSWDGTLFAFASEIKGLLAHPAVPRRPSEPALAAFLAEGALDEGAGTFFEGIRALPPGHCATLDLGTRRLEVRRWYTLPAPEPRRGDPLELKELLTDAVRLRLRSDVAVGTCLSGGLDSSSIVALTTALGPTAAAAGQHSFSICFPDPELDESRFIQAVVDATGVTSARISPTSRELLSDLPALVRHQDEPIPSASPYAQWCVMRLARQSGVSVLLDGQGGDELLAGYHYHFGPFLAECGFFAALGEAARARAVTGRPLAFFLALLAYHTLPLPAALRSWAVARWASHGRVPHAALDPGFAAQADGVISERHRPRRCLLEERRAALSCASLPALLRYEDRSSMAFSIEARTPFLDYRLVERALALPATDLIRDGWTKWLLREAMRGVLPEAVRTRRDKLGFAVPERRWLAELAPQVRDWLGPGARLRGRLRPAVLDAWLAEPDADLARRTGLWRLLSAELWLRYVEQVT